MSAPEKTTGQDESSTYHASSAAERADIDRAAKTTLGEYVVEYVESAKDAMRRFFGKEEDREDDSEKETVSANEVSVEQTGREQSSEESRDDQPKHEVKISQDQEDSPRHHDNWGEVSALGHGREWQMTAQDVIDAREQVYTTVSAAQLPAGEERVALKEDLVDKLVEERFGESASQTSQTKDRYEKDKAVFRKALSEGKNRFQARLERWDNFRQEGVTSIPETGVEIVNIQEAPAGTAVRWAVPASAIPSGFTSGEPRKVAEKLATQPEPTPVTPRAEKKPSQEDSVELHESDALRDARITMSEAYAARIIGPTYMKQDIRRQLETEHKDQVAEYQRLLRVEVNSIIDDMRAQGKTDQEIRDFLVNDANRRAFNNWESQRRVLVEKSGWVGKSLEWYNKQSTAKKIAIGVGVGAVGFASGAVVGLLAGAFGGLVGAAGIGAAGSVGFGRLFGTARVYNLRKAEIYGQPKELRQLQLTNDDTMTVDEVRYRYIDHVSGMVTEQADRAVEVKKKASKWALGTFAVGAAVGGVSGVLHHIATADTGQPSHVIGGQVEHWLKNLLKEHGGRGVSGLEKTPPIPEGTRTPGTILPPQETVKGGSFDGDARPIEIHPNYETTTTHTIEHIDTESYIQDHIEASHIQRGEGWYQTFKELGMSPEERRAFLREYGDDLLSMKDDYGKSIAFRMSNGDIGINMTRDGKMPRSVLEFITSRAHEKGYIQLSTIQEKVTVQVPIPEVARGVDLTGDGTVDIKTYAPVSQDQIDALSQFQTVGPNETVRQTFHELARAIGASDISDVQQQQILNDVGPKLQALKYDNGTPVVRFEAIKGYILNPSPLPGGKLHAGAIELLFEAAKGSYYSLAA